MYGTAYGRLLSFYLVVVHKAWTTSTLLPRCAPIYWHVSMKHGLLLNTSIAKLSFCIWTTKAFCPSITELYRSFNEFQDIHNLASHIFELYPLLYSLVLFGFVQKCSVCSGGEPQPLAHLSHKLQCARQSLKIMVSYGNKYPRHKNAATCG